MDVKYQVFISSTFQDLKDERRVLMEQILNLGHIPVGMELFQASNQEQWTYIKKRILTCDYYLLVVAERYGSLGEDGKSYTQLEYEFAVANGIPVAAFLLDGAVRGSRPSKDVEHERKAEIEAFRTLCSESKMVKFWRDPADLALKATNALLGLIEEEPRQGWVRADQSSEAALWELAKLAEEKRELEERLSSFVGQPGTVVPDDVAYHLRSLKQVKLSQHITSADQISLYNDVSLLELFMRNSRSLAIEIAETNLHMALLKSIKAEEMVGISMIVRPAFSAVIAEYGAIGIIENMRNDPNFGRYFRMTDYGRKLLMFAERTYDLVQPSA